jgi:hypothetical protein
MWLVVLIAFLHWIRCYAMAGGCTIPRLLRELRRTLHSWNVLDFLVGLFGVIGQPLMAQLDFSPHVS